MPQCVVTPYLIYLQALTHNASPTRLRQALVATLDEWKQRVTCAILASGPGCLDLTAAPWGAPP